MTTNQTNAMERLLSQTPKFARDETKAAFERLIDGNEGLDRMEFTTERDGTEFDCVLDLTPTESALGHKLLIVNLMMRPTNKDKSINFMRPTNKDKSINFIAEA